VQKWLNQFAVVDLDWPKEAQVNRIRQVAPMYPDGRAHTHHLANMIELSVCRSDADLCQLTLNTCFLLAEQLQ